MVYPQFNYQRYISLEPILTLSHSKLQPMPLSLSTAPPLPANTTHGHRPSGPLQCPFSVPATQSLKLQVNYQIDNISRPISEIYTHKSYQQIIINKSQTTFRRRFKKEASTWHKPGGAERLMEAEILSELGGALYAAGTARLADHRSWLLPLAAALCTSVPVVYGDIAYCTLSLSLILSITLAMSS